ncbi:hypothetical protein O6H91_Y239300 [Diphasiastrum complanatum]|nr:hypothetical protein O6H91_Y239300 [Diphasiastrum complanatum]
MVMWIHLSHLCRFLDLMSNLLMSLQTQMFELQEANRSLCREGGQFELFTAALATHARNVGWYIDSGASKHMTPHRDC